MSTSSATRSNRDDSRIKVGGDNGNEDSRILISAATGVDLVIVPYFLYCYKMALAGDEAQDKQIIGSCWFNGEITVFSIPRSASVEEIHAQIGEEWSDFNSDAYVVQYLAPHKKGLWVSLRREGQMPTMIQLHELAKLNIVEMRAIRPPAYLGGKQASKRRKRRYNPYADGSCLATVRSEVED